MKHNERIALTSIDDEAALDILCRLAGSTKNFSEISGIPYYKVNNILHGKQLIKQEMLLSFYRERLTDEFRSILEDAHRLTSALAEIGIIKPGEPLTEMDDFESKVFSLTHDEPESKPEPKPEPEGTLPATFVAEVTSGGEPKQVSMPLKTDPKKFGFRSKKPLDKTPSPAYTSSTVDNLIDNVEDFILQEPEVADPSPVTGDILKNVKTGGNGNATPIGDAFETGFRLDIPDRFDSDNKRW